jgi:hypothetical protein
LLFLKEVLLVAIITMAADPVAEGIVLGVGAVK